MPSFAVVQNLTRPLERAPRIELCNSFGSKLRGLMFRPSIDPDEGILLMGSRDQRLDAGIHMLFVPFDLAVFWISSRMEVVDKVLARSWHPAYLPSKPSRYVLEVHPSLHEAYRVGDSVEIIHA